MNAGERNKPMSRQSNHQKHINTAIPQSTKDAHTFQKARRNCLFVRKMGHLATPRPTKKVLCIPRDLFAKQGPSRHRTDTFTPAAFFPLRAGGQESSSGEGVKQATGTRNARQAATEPIDGLLVWDARLAEVGIGLTVVEGAVLCRAERRRRLRLVEEGVVFPRVWGALEAGEEERVEA